MSRFSSIVADSGFGHESDGGKRAETGWGLSDSRFRSLADAAPVLMWMTDPDRSWCFFNKPWLEFTGRSVLQEAGQGWMAGVHPDDLDQFLIGFAAAFEAQAAFVMDFRLRRSDGEYRWLSTRGVPYWGARGEFAGYMGSCTDITNQKEVEKAGQELSGLLIRALEEQRARLARELHDDVTQRLARLATDIARFAKHASLNEEEENLIRGVSDGLVSLSQDVHGLSYELHPSALIDLGLEDALRVETERFSQRESVSVQLRMLRLPKAIARDTALALFRIAQEALNNAVRHGRASKVEVTLWGTGDGLQLMVDDNGVGFDPSRRRSTPSLGLASMRERTRLAGGEFEIKSKVGVGTTITAWAPA